MNQHSHAATEAHNDDARKIASRLKFFFAVLSCLGGMVLTSGTSFEAITLMAVFFAIFGYVFVDWLELFALPPIAAYAAMGLAAIYCVSDFVDLDAPGNHQMIAVAQLLVFVQGILMMQRKTRRILEQLGVFCLLELIVAAVFNNAINFGLLLVPISIVGAWAISSLAAISALEGLHTNDGLEEDTGYFGKRSEPASTISVSATESVQSISSVAMRLPTFTLIALAPAVLLVGTIFFYALPRTTEAARGSRPGQALVGFSDVLRLEQIGEMMQSTAPALRIRLIDRKTGTSYRINEGMYLRGRVLERYSQQRASAVWSELNDGMVLYTENLPTEFVPNRSTDKNFYDSVRVQISAESSRSRALFATGPLHRSKSEPDLEYCLDRSTIARRGDDGWNYSRVSYEFGSHAFRKGNQSDLIARLQVNAGSKSPTAPALPLSDTEFSAEAIERRSNRTLARAANERRIEEYRDALLDFDRDEMPGTAELASNLAQSEDGERKSDSELARQMEQFLATSQDFEYTLNLNAKRYPGMDPIEQFVTIDKRGHCQYFASALAMMLRSEGIPARIVVGYHTDEFNEIGDHYIARQLHAHAWVEALIRKDQLNHNRNVYGQPSSDAYWLRLDPTPSSARFREDPSGVGQVFDMAQNMWDDYVVEMDGKRQEKTFLGQPGNNPLHGSYEKFLERLSTVIGKVRAGELGGGSLAGRNLFSWPAAVLGIGLTLLTAMLLRIQTPKWLRRQRDVRSEEAVAIPTIPFYAQTLDQLSRVGVHRSAAQTPSELAIDATSRLQYPQAPSIKESLEILTKAFYRTRFGGDLSDLEPLAKLEHDLSPDPGKEPQAVHDALAELTQNVNLLTSIQTAAEQEL
ncbi:MAG: transglutaminaseTgpA domain-containing protein [Rubripirellula sp.]